MKNKRCKYFITVFLIILNSVSFISAAKNTAPLRLAIWNNPNTAIVKDSGEITGFEPEFFKTLSSYANRPSEIKVYNNKKDSLEALKNNEVDVIMSCLYTSDIDKEFDFTNIMVRNVDAILCTLNKSYSYQEYDAIANKSIGYLDRGNTTTPILEYLKEKIYNPYFVPFNTIQEIKDALASNEIEFAVFGMGALDDSLTILDRFNALPTFYITRTGESRIINDALASLLNNSSDLYSDIHYEFYPRSITTELTKEEKNYISKNNQIYVITGSDKNVFSSIDENGNIVGIYPDIINEINEISGLNLKLIANDKHASISSILDSSKADVAIGLDGLKEMDSNNDLVFSESIMQIPMELIFSRNNSFNKEEVQRIAISKKNNIVDTYVKENFPNWEIIYEPNFEARYNLLLKNKIDCLIDSSYSFNFLNPKANYQNLASYPVSLFNSEIIIATRKENNQELYSIINKSLVQLKKNNLNQIIENNISAIVYTQTFRDLFISHRLEYLAILSIILILFSFIYIKTSRKRHKNLEKTNNDLVKAEQNAIEANEAKSIFLARMSHDMRTPLGAIIGISNFGITEAENETIKSYFADIDDSAEYLLSLMDDILDSQKLQNDNFEFKSTVVNLCDTIKRVKTIIEKKANEKNIELNISGNFNDLDKYIFADGKRITQIFINILNNAIKYTKTNGKITWDINYNLEDNEKVLITSKIQDNGVGMSEEFVKTKLFKPFSKEANSLSKSEGGTGLGLNICKKLIDQMGGKISCNSIINEGTTFIIELPLKIASKEETEKLNYSCDNKNKKIDNAMFKDIKILVCDDTKINIKIEKKILEDRGIIVDVAYNGQEAIDKAKENNFDAILMDIRMPIVNGLEATKEIRLFNKTIPIIAFSANAYTEDIKQSLEAGMNAHLAKPVDVDKLFIVLEEEIFKTK
jgi:signal transduction histidine kinase/CheY-like chemotaxis protein/membrane-bound lytic murein transglycosylase MltF